MRRFVVIWIAILILAGAVGFLAHSITSARDNQNVGIRNFTCFFETAVLASPNQSPKQKLAAIKFFNGETNILGVPTCPATPEKGGTNG